MFLSFSLREIMIMTPSEVLEKALAIQKERVGQWGDAYKLCPLLLNKIKGKNQSVAEWCADMCVLKLTRFYQSGCTSVDSIIDLINYAAMSLDGIESDKKVHPESEVTALIKSDVLE